MKKHFSIFFLLVSLSSFSAIGQKPSIVSTKKFTPPAVKTFLGGLNTDNAFCNAEAGRQIINQPLLVLDEKRNSYVIAHYDLAYTRIGVTEDEQTGKTSPMKDMVGSRFNVVPLPELWRKNIIETLQKGETLYFYDVYCYDKQGRLFVAPNLKIEIQ
jgi:hypothetical protein